jgi:hypothetical protein
MLSKSWTILCLSVLSFHCGIVHSSVRWKRSESFEISVETDLEEPKSRKNNVASDRVEFTNQVIHPSHSYKLIARLLFKSNIM